jgi:hypothetical protein
MDAVTVPVWVQYLSNMTAGEVEQPDEHGKMFTLILFAIPPLKPVVLKCSD